MPKESYRGLPVNGLIAFEAAARLGSFSRAAEELLLSQAAISRQMHTLENSLGTQLFVRQRYNVALTDHGKDLFASVSPFLAELARTTDQIQQQNGNRQEFIIYCDMSLTHATLMPSLPRFYAANEGENIWLVSSHVPIEDYPHPFDIGVQTGRWAESRFEVTTILQDEVFPVCKPDMVELFVRPDGSVDLNLATLLKLEQPGRDWPDWERYFADAGIDFPNTRQMVFNNHQALLDASESGYGVALGWGHRIKSQLKTGRLGRVGRQSLTMPDGLCAYVPKERPPHPLAARFIEWLGGL